MYVWVGCVRRCVTIKYALLSLLHWPRTTCAFFCRIGVV